MADHMLRDDDINHINGDLEFTRSQRTRTKVDRWVSDFHKTWLACVDHSVKFNTVLDKLKVFMPEEQIVEVVYSPINNLHHSSQLHGCVDTSKEHTEIPSVAGKLTVVPHIVIGCLTSSPRKGTNGNAGNIYLEDKSGSVPCQISSQNIQYVSELLDSWLLVTCWNLIHSGRTGWYIELCGELFCLSKSGFKTGSTCREDTSAKHVQAVYRDAALSLLQYRSGLQMLTVNVAGTVSAISEIFRIKHVSMFLVQLDIGLNIVVKSDRLFHWQTLIQPHKDYVFTKLKPSSLKQGSSSKRRVYVACENSELFLQDHCSVTVLGAEDWLKQQDILDVPTFTVDQFPDQCVKLICYKGRITAVLDAELGVYELDNKAVRLCLSCIPAANKFCYLREGTFLTVYNAHCKTSAQIPKLVLYCCIFSCIKVTEFPVLDSKTKPFIAPPSLQTLLFLDGVNGDQQDWLFQVRNVLRTQFQTSCDRRVVDRTLHTIMESSELSWTRKEGKQRNLLEEFLSPCHQCCLTKTEIQIGNLPVYTTVRDVLSDCRLHLDADTSHYWQYDRSQVSDKILLGVLLLCPRTGRAKLRDDTGEIDIITTCCHGNGDHSNHITGSCSSLAPGHVFQSSHLQTSCVGKVVALKKYKSVQELFCLDDKGSGPIVHRTFQYLEVCLTDCVYVSTRSLDSSSTAVMATAGTRRKLDNKDLPGNLETKTLHMSIEDSHHSKSQIIIQVKSKESLVLDNRKGSCNGLQFSVCAVVNGHPNFDNDFEVSLLFQDDSLKWFSAIYPGGVYKLSVDSGTTVVKRSEFTNSKIDKVIQRSKAKQCLLVDPAVTVYKLSDRDVPLTSVAEIVSNQFSGIFVNFKGIIISRSHMERDVFAAQRKLADTSLEDKYISTLDDRVVMVTVRDIEGPTSVQVYMKLEGTGYPLGVLAGAVVQWYQLERRVSKLGNIYCQYNSLSTLTVLHPQKQGSSVPAAETQTLQPEADEEEQPPKCHLVDIWKGKGNYGEITECLCYVLQVVRLSLKCVCIKCSSVMVSCCTNPGCSRNTAARFAAKASLIVSDGTSSAMVTSFGLVIQGILNLTDDQWTTLEDEVKGHGEVFIKQNGGMYDTGLERFVSLLCNSSHIKRPVVMKLRPNFHQQSTFTDLNSMELKDFPEVTLSTGRGSLTTHCLPLPQLECFAVRKVDPNEWCLHYLNTEQN